VQAVKFDRDELTIWVEKDAIREVSAILPTLQIARSTIWPTSPAWIGIPRNRGLKSFTIFFRFRRKSECASRPALRSSPAIETVTSVWPSANHYEREVFDLFGVRSPASQPDTHHDADDWEGHPLRKDYPVEGYR